MSLGTTIAIWSLFWFATFFAVLPWGVRTDEETGATPVAGAPESAPTRPMMWRKLLWTTVIATALFALFEANWFNGWVTIDDLPGMDRMPAVAR